MSNLTGVGRTAHFGRVTCSVSDPRGIIPHMRDTPRRRHYVSEGTLKWLRFLGFTYDYRLDAYVLIGIGWRFGPVFRDRTKRGLSEG